MVSAYKNHRNSRKLSFSLQVVAELNATHYRHRPVCDDEVGLFFVSGNKPLTTIASGHDSIAFELKDAFPRSHNAEFVIHAKNGFHLCWLRVSGRRRHGIRQASCLLTAPPDSSTFILGERKRCPRRLTDGYRRDPAVSACGLSKALATQQEPDCCVERATGGLRNAALVQQKRTVMEQDFAHCFVQSGGARISIAAAV
jgi:hypothetical protein